MSTIKTNKVVNANAESYENSAMPESIKIIIKKGRPIIDNRKIAISIRLSAEVLNFFKEDGRGWQTRIGNVLQDYVVANSEA